jgi:hypothetical protein
MVLSSGCGERDQKLGRFGGPDNSTLCRNPTLTTPLRSTPLATRHTTDAEKRISDGRGRVADGRGPVADGRGPDLQASVAGDLSAAMDDGAGAGCARPGWAFPAAAGTCS